ncbi:MAG: twin-arginine translocation signal domain-containing protein, partial [Bacteroidota bacterium]
MPTPISRRKFLGNVSVGAGTIGLPGYISQT